MKVINKDKAAVKVFATIAAFYFFHYATLGTIVPFGGYFFKLRNFTGTEIGLLLAIFPINKFLFTNLWTALFSRIDRKSAFISVCVMLSALSMVPIFWITSAAFTAVCMFLFSMFRAGVVPSIDNIAITFGDKYNIPYGKMRLFGSIGFIFSALLTGFLFERLGSDAFLIVFISLGFISGLPVLFINITDYSVKIQKHDDVRLNKGFIVMLAAVVVYLMSFSFHSNFFNIKIKEAGLSQDIAGSMWALGVTVEVFLMFFASHFLKIMSARTLVALSMAAGVLRYTLIASTANIYMLYLASSLHGFAFGTFHIGFLIYISRTVRPKARLRAQSLYSGLGFGFGFFAGSAVSGLIYDSFGVDNTFYTASIIAALSAITAYLAAKDSTSA